MAEYIDKQTALKIIASFRTPYRKEVRVEDVYDAVNKSEGVEIIERQPVVTINSTAEEIKVTNCNDKPSAWGHENDLIHREDALNCFHDWIDQRGDVHTADEMPEYQRIEQLPSAQPEKRTEERTETHSCDCISRQAAIKAISCNITITGRQNAELVAATIGAFADRIKALPSALPERVWTPCSNPPKHHRDVIVRGVEAIGNVTVYKVMQWDVDTWRPTDYAPSVMWKEWSEI